MFKYASLFVKNKQYIEIERMREGRRTNKPTVRVSDVWDREASTSQTACDLCTPVLSDHLAFFSRKPRRAKERGEEMEGVKDEENPTACQSRARRRQDNVTVDRVTAI